MNFPGGSEPYLTKSIPDYDFFHGVCQLVFVSIARGRGPGMEFILQCSSVIALYNLAPK